MAPFFKERLGWPPTCRCWLRPLVFWETFSTLVLFNASSSFIGPQGFGLMTKTDLTFPAFCKKFVGFASAVNFLLKEKHRSIQIWQSMAWFPWNNRNSVLRIAADEFPSFCIENRFNPCRPCVYSVIDHRRCQNLVRTLVTHSSVALYSTFLFLLSFRGLPGSIT